MVDLVQIHNYECEVVKYISIRKELNFPTLKSDIRGYFQSEVGIIANLDTVLNNLVIDNSIKIIDKQAERLAKMIEGELPPEVIVDDFADEVILLK